MGLNNPNLELVRTLKNQIKQTNQPMELIFTYWIIGEILSFRFALENLYGFVSSVEDNVSN